MFTTKRACHLIVNLILELAGVASSLARPKLLKGLIHVVSCSLLAAVTCFLTLILLTKLAFRSRLTPHGGWGAGELLCRKL